MKIGVLVLIILSCYLLHSCSMPSNCDRYYFSEDYKAYYSFEDQSYWIYYDSINNIYDTLTLIHDTIFLDGLCTVSHIPQEKHEQIFRSSYFEGDNNYQFRADGAAYLNKYEGGIYLGGNGTNLVNSEMIDSMVINHILYYNLMKVNLLYGCYYYCPHIGIVKKQINDSVYGTTSFGDTIYSFELIEYGID